MVSNSSKYKVSKVSENKFNNGNLKKENNVSNSSILSLKSSVSKTDLKNSNIVLNSNSIILNTCIENINALIAYSLIIESDIKVVIRLKLYWLIGKVIEDLKEGYKGGINQLILKLSNSFGTVSFISCSRSNLYNAHRFFLAYKSAVKEGEIANFNSLEFIRGLSFTHYIELLKVDISKRRFYEIQTIELGLSSVELRSYIKLNPPETIPVNYLDSQLLKGFYNLNFLGSTLVLKKTAIELAIIKNIRQFLITLGEGWVFLSNQTYFSDSRINPLQSDLVFYNVRSRQYLIIVIELKSNHQKTEIINRIEQIQLYLNFFDEEVIDKKYDKPTLGLILCYSTLTVKHFNMCNSKDTIHFAGFSLF